MRPRRHSRGSEPSRAPPSGHTAGTLATGHVLGQQLEAVLTQGGEVDRQVNSAQAALGKVCAGRRPVCRSDSHLIHLLDHASETTFALGQNIRSAIDLASRPKTALNSDTSAPPEAVGAWGNRRELGRRTTRGGHCGQFEILAPAAWLALARRFDMAHDGLGLTREAEAFNRRSDHVDDVLAALERPGEKRE